MTHARLHDYEFINYVSKTWLTWPVYGSTDLDNDNDNANNQ